MTNQTEAIDPSLSQLDLQTNDEILRTLLLSQQRALDAVDRARPAIDQAIDHAVARLEHGNGRLVLTGAGASGRLAVQDGAEMWPTFGWPHSRLLLCMAGGADALLSSVEGVEDDVEAALQQVLAARIEPGDVVLAVAASGTSAWTCAWLEQSRKCGALTIGMANNAGTPLLLHADSPIFLDSGTEVLAGSTRMAAGTAQKIALNIFSTTLMIRLNRTYGNLMVDMAAVNSKLDGRRIRLLQGVLPTLTDDEAREALAQADGWVKLAALIALGDNDAKARERLNRNQGSLRNAITSLEAEKQA